MLYKYRRVKSELYIHAIWCVFFNLGHDLLSGLGGFQGIGTGAKIHRHGDRRFAVKTAAKGVIFRTQLNPGNVPQMQAGRIWLSANNDVFKLFYRRQPSLRAHGIGKGLIAGHGLGAKTARRKIGILLANGSGDICRCQTQLSQSVRLKPNTHGIVARAHQPCAANTRQAAQLVDNIEQRIVA